ncbi:mechanosensitive ion channel family protein [Acanthopleuribacter pedis]|uniref:Mechanosensitive ion channel family protein n=1 Tax=Acanthopleuribacter pedis TaxID=442870 RepID=A0A8J7QAM0_9BACT|nr:mechanosensitive ion channel family protein [Acanthopleuribacter pedis]MBO1320922.1 mechanosensitive ion channel family protein [Acanthopleuribacter pedis]
MFTSAIEALNSKFSQWLDTAVAHFPNFMVAVLILMMFFLVAKGVALVVKRVTQPFNHNQTIVDLLVKLAQIVFICVGLFVAMGVLGLQKAVTSLLAGAGLVGLALGLAFQDLVTNLIAGIFLGIRQPFRQGDVVETGGLLGTVKKLSLRNTLLEDFNGRICILPNNEVFQKPLINYSLNGIRRVDIPVGIAYDSDLRQASNLAVEAVSALDFIDEGLGAPEGVFTQFNDSSIDMEVRFWIQFPGPVSFPEAKSQGIIAIRKAFAEAGIEIPFPIRTLTLEEGADALPINLFDQKRENRKSA